MSLGVMATRAGGYFSLCNVHMSAAHSVVLIFFVSLWVQKHFTLLPGILMV